MPGEAVLRSTADIILKYMAATLFPTLCARNNSIDDCFINIVDIVDVDFSEQMRAIDSIPDFRNIGASRILLYSTLECIYDRFVLSFSFTALLGSFRCPSSKVLIILLLIHEIVCASAIF